MSGVGTRIQRALFGKRKQELHCHECQRYVQFEMDFDLNGNHVIECPNCGHEHCRVVKNGKITGIRWDSRNFRVQVPQYVITTSFVSTYNSCFSSGGSSGGGSVFLYQSWMDTTTSGT